MYAIVHPMSLVTPPTADENYNAATLPSAIPEIVNHTNKGTYVLILPLVTCSLKVGRLQ